MRRLPFAVLPCLVASLSAQQPPDRLTVPRADDHVGMGMLFERREQHADAAAQYRLALEKKPADAAALMGLERVLGPMGKRGEIATPLASALRSDSTNIGVLMIAVRHFARTGARDSLRKYVDRWVAKTPNDDSPFREWSQAALEGRDLPSAKEALTEGRRRIADGQSLTPELAQLLQAEGDYAGAVREWATVLATSPLYRNGALILLGQTPPAQRTALRTALAREEAATPALRPLHALLAARWGEAEAGFEMLRRALPADATAGGALLGTFLDEIRARNDVATLRVRAAALQALAERQQGQVAVRTMMDAARTYADAGMEAEARRLLAAVASSGNAPPGMATNASTALLGVLIAEGKAAEAEQVLRDLAGSIDLDERERQARRVALAWVKRGDFDRADAIVARDSSIAGFDLRGRLRLYRGDLAGATVLLKEAGPFDEERDHAVERVTLLALLQAIAKDSLPALGAALFALERGDSAAGGAALEALAPSLPPAGAAETRLLAGRVAAGRRDTAAAFRLLAAADLPDWPGTAAQARLELARLHLAAGRRREAGDLLERLILDFPQSAVVPEARRLRDTLRTTPTGAAS